jgi:hypothetical protein
MHNRDYGNTVADSYKNGPAPSERMKKFNSSQAPLINPSNSMINEYNNLASTDMSQRMNSEPKNVTQNLRLLKTKMRLGSATSTESEPYVNIPMKNQGGRNNANNDMQFRKSSNNPVMNSFENGNNSMQVFSSAKKNSDHVYSSSRKQKPVKADHRMFGSSKRANESMAMDNVTSMFTPKMATPNKAYETTSGGKFRSTQRSTAGDDESKYLSSAEIEKLADPKGSMLAVSTDLASKDWEVQVNACNVLRSIAIHDKNLLNSTFFKVVLPDLIKIAASLRSSVSKNGLLVFQDLFQN